MKSMNHLDLLRIASPCPANWDQMNGDDRVRFCDLCNLHVYNIARLTRKEAESLIAGADGRICARLFRRSDGTIITKDCPVGLRAIRRRVAKVAGAVFATIMSLCGIVAGQKPSAKDKSCRQQVTITKSTPASKQEAGSISGTVVDQNGAVVPGARVQIAHKNSSGALTTTETNDQGSFQLHGLKSDTYELSLESRGFTSLKSVEIKLGDQESVTVTVVLLPDSATATVGLLMAYEPLIDTPPGRTIFSGDLIRRLPH
jgi:hypothetical protein